MSHHPSVRKLKINIIIDSLSMYIEKKMLQYAELPHLKMGDNAKQIPVLSFGVLLPQYPGQIFISCS
jgi:hypothetical protein